MMSPSETFADATEVRCRPCRHTFRVQELVNPKRCATCGGPTVSLAQMEQFQAATGEALETLKTRSVWIMRATSLSMVSVQILTYFIKDRTIATFFNDVVTAAAITAAVATEAWAFTGSRLWMILASLSIQVAAILFFFVAMPLLYWLVEDRLAVEIACLPLAGSLLGWYQFRAYSQLLQLNQKKR